MAKQDNILAILSIRYRCDELGIPTVYRLLYDGAQLLIPLSDNHINDVVCHSRSNGIEAHGEELIQCDNIASYLTENEAISLIYNAWKRKKKG